MTQETKKIRRLRKGRSTALLVLVIILATLISGSFSKAATDMERPMASVVVAEGDTMWGLVQAHYAYAGDIRQAIYEVRQLNGLNSATINPGQVLLIPLR